MADLKKIVFDKVSVVMYLRRDDDYAPGTKEKPGLMTVEDAAKLIGWSDESAGNVEFKSDFKFRDKLGHKIRLLNNGSNRPFRMSLALRYANEILRGKWYLNGETVIFDRRGDCQSGQHRLVGLVLAEQLRKKNPEQWAQYGTKSPCKIEAIVIYGIDESNEVIDSIDNGQTRSLGDVIFRDHQYENVSEREQTRLSRILAGATRLAWLRCGGKTVSDAPHFPKSEALDFIEEHAELVKEVNFIFAEEGEGAEEGRKISKYISLPFAAALCYLMGISKTDAKKFDAEGSTRLDTSLMERAEEFWTLFASGAGLAKDDPILVLRNKLVSMSQGGASERDAVIGAVVLAWNAWIDGKKVSAKDLTIQVKTVNGKKVVVDQPYLGGLDIYREPTVAVETTNGKEDKTAKGPKKAAKGATTAPKAPKKAKAKGEPVSYPFKAGDEVFVRTVDKDGNNDNPGRVVRIDPETGMVTWLFEETKQEYRLNPAKDPATDFVFTEKPADWAA